MFWGYIILLIVCILAYYRRKYFLPNNFLYLQYLLVIVLVLEITKQILKGSRININPLNHIYEVTELILLSSFFYKLLKEKTIKRFILVVTPFLVIMYSLISIFVEGIYNNNTFSFISESIIMSIFSAFFFYELYISTTEEKVITNPAFWVCAGILIYNCGTFFQMGLYNYLEKRNHQLAEQLKIINYILNYFLYATYLAGFLCTRKQS